MVGSVGAGTFASVSACEPERTPHEVSLGLGITATTALLLGAPSALAQVQVGRAERLGQRGDLTVGAERLFGLNITNNGGAAGGDFNQTSFSLALQRSNSPLTLPRVAVDYYFISNLALGGTFGFYEAFDSEAGDGIFFGPRVSYAIPLSRSWTLLPRGGFSYYSEDGGGGRFSVFALSLEGAMALTIARDFGFLGSLTLDVSLTGSGPTAPDDSFSQSVIGIPMLGMYVLFD